MANQERINRFIQHVRDATRKKKTRCILSRKRFLASKEFPQPINGYFNEYSLVVATGQSQKKWLPIFVHEFSHFLQWKNDLKVWHDTDDIASQLGDIDPLSMWLAGKKYSEYMIKKYVHALRYCELDCERGSLELIYEFDLPIDQEEYCKRASAYMYFYNFVLKNRQWYKIGREPYNVKQILRHMPTDLNREYIKTPKKIMKLLEKYCL